MIKHLSFVIFIWAIVISSPEAQTYIREYTYNASEVDSKISSRINALDQIKSILLQEIGTHIRKEINITKDGNGNTFASEDVEAITAGLTKVDIIEENWNGETYYLKAKIEADTARVLNALEVFRNEKDEERRQQYKILKENQRNLKAAREEVALLKKQLAQVTSLAEQEKLVVKYRKQVDQLSLSDMYDRGYNYFQQVKYEDAFYWYRKAAEQGHAPSQFALGDMYEVGFGDKQDDGLAVYWYLKVAEKGYASAQYRLGHIYGDCYKDIGDVVLGVFWLHKAAEQGYAPAQDSLGSVYQYGIRLICGSSPGADEGVDQNYPLAIYWYRKAAEQGRVSSMYALAYIYEKGDGIKQDRKNAHKWYKKYCKSELKRLKSDKRLKGPIRDCTPYDQWAEKVKISWL